MSFQIHRSLITASIRIQIGSFSELDGTRSDEKQLTNSRNVYTTIHKRLSGRFPQADVACILPGLFTVLITGTNTTTSLDKDLWDYVTDKL